MIESRGQVSWQNTKPFRIFILFLWRSPLENYQSANPFAWNHGIVEYWNDGLFEIGLNSISFPQYSIIPTFQHSNNLRL